MLIKPGKTLGKELGLTKDLYKPYMCPRCVRTSNEHICPHCGSECNLILY